jgi:hypothetical protein
LRILRLFLFFFLMLNSVYEEKKEKDGFCLRQKRHSKCHFSISPSLLSMSRERQTFPSWTTTTTWHSTLAFSQPLSMPRPPTSF